MDKTYNVNGSAPPRTKRTADLEGPDFYPTPLWATHALLGHETFEGDIWEPACGNGAMSKVILDAGYDVYSSDLFARGFGEQRDFLGSDRRVSNIITNPPYHSAEAFFHKAWDNTERKIAFLLRLAFLEGVNRNKTIYQVKPPARVWVFSERVTMYMADPVDENFLPKEDKTPKKNSGTTQYAWFVWDKYHTGNTELKWLTPGYKAKYKTAGKA
jgi:hypothetical protein